MDKFIIKGGVPLKGRVSVSGAKNVALKALVAACLTSEEVVIENVPLISDFFTMVDIIKELGGEVQIDGHTAKVRVENFTTEEISLENAARSRTTSMFMAPLLVRKNKAIIPNPGGCRLGARPIDRTIEGLRLMGADVVYHSEDGYFRAKANGLHGITYAFDKNTHTGTETLIIAGVLAKGKTILENAAEEPEIDELIDLLNRMGAKIARNAKRVIEIEGVDRLHGATTRIKPDRNEIVTMAIAAILTEGDVFVEEAKRIDLEDFLVKLEAIGAGVEEKENGMRFFYKGPLTATNVDAVPFPGFMTDWQAPWAVLMTKAQGKSVVHETVFENRFSYVTELKKMGAHIELFNPEVKNPEVFYNFNMADDKPEYFHAISISGPTTLHSAIVTVSDLRAGATLVLGALAAKGESIIYGIKHLDRGYERFEQRLGSLGANVQRIKEEK